MSRYKTEGYDPGENAGPLMIPAHAAPNMSTVDTLNAQLARTTDPKMRKQLMVRLALEQKYAQDAAAAQELVQQNAMQNGWSPIRDANATSAAMQRAALQQKAENERAFALGKPMTTLWHLA